MSFTVVDRKDDQEQEDAVRRGVAEGLARLLGVPKHPDSVQAMLDQNARGEQAPGAAEPICNAIVLQDRS